MIPDALMQQVISRLNDVPGPHSRQPVEFVSARVFPPTTNPVELAGDRILAHDPGQSLIAVGNPDGSTTIYAGLAYEVTQRPAQEPRVVVPG